MVLKHVLDIDEAVEVFLNQDEHYLLNIFADNIKKGKFHYSIDINQELIADLNKLVAAINEQLPDKTYSLS